MANRFNAKDKSKSRFGVPPLETGYEGQPSSDFNIPSVGIEDTDRAMFKLFNEELPLMVKKASGVERIPVIFTSGEKWAMLRKGTPRDKNGTLVIPSIAIGRTTIEQNPQTDITGRGINQNTGVIKIKRKLDSTDKSYQNLINRLLIKNQSNVALNHDDELLSDQISTNSEIGDLVDDPTIQDGGMLLPNKLNNVWETIVIPQPQFYTATYEVIVWSQYMTQMNDILTSLISSFLPQGNAWRLETETGYWFIAKINGDLNFQNNFDNMSNDERMIKYTFNITVPSYILVGSAPGMPIAIRRYVSNPSISFGISSFEEVPESDGTDVFLGSDDPTLPSSLQKSKRPDQRETNDTRLLKTGQDDPALSGSRKRIPTKYRTINGIDSKGRSVKRFVKVTNQNSATGETIYHSTTDLDGISIKTIV